MKSIFLDYFNEAVKEHLAFEDEKMLEYGFSFKFKDLEELYKKDMSSGDGADFKSYPNYSLLYDEKLMVSDPDSIYSYKFGIRGNDPPLAESKRFRCDCGKTEAPSSGIKCNYCKQITEYRPILRGWYSLGSYKVFNPMWFSFLLNNYQNKEQGPKKVPKYDSLIKKITTKTSEFYYFKLLESFNTDRVLIKELIHSCCGANNYTAIKYLEENIHLAMTSRIPVMSKDYRYYRITKKISNKTNNDVDNHAYNTSYINISNNIKRLESLSEHSSKYTILSNIMQINKLFLDINDITIKNLTDGKECLIRKDLGTRRFGFSARLVASARPIKMDEVILPYEVFGSMTVDNYKSIYIKYGMTAESESRMKANTPNIFDKSIMSKVLKELIINKDNILLVGRQPAVYQTSVQALKLIALANDSVCYLSDISLSKFGGDKDGDTLFLIWIESKISLQMSFALNPRKSIIDPVTLTVDKSVEYEESTYLNIFLALDEVSSVKTEITDYDEAEDLVWEKDMEKNKKKILTEYRTGDYI